MASEFDAAPQQVPQQVMRAKILRFGENFRHIMSFSLKISKLAAQKIIVHCARSPFKRARRNQKKSTRTKHFEAIMTVLPSRTWRRISFRPARTTSGFPRSPVSPCRPASFRRHSRCLVAADRRLRHRPVDRSAPEGRGIERGPRRDRNIDRATLRSLARDAHRIADPLRPQDLPAQII